MEDVSEEQP